MEPLTIEAACLTQNNTQQGSNATFVVKSETQPTAQPGQPARVAAKKVVQANFDDGTAKQFTTGKRYKITFEEIAE